MTSLGRIDRTVFSHLAVADPCNFLLLRNLLIRGFGKEVLRVLYVKLAQLLGSGSMELGCSALLHDGFLGSWKLEEFRTRP